MKVLCIYREEEFSGNKEADKALLDNIAIELKNFKEVEVVVSSEVCKVEAEVIISMARSKKNLAKLKKLEIRGARVLNPPDAVATCLRRWKVENLLKSENIPTPKTSIISSQPFKPLPFFKSVLKRADMHGDTRIVNTGENKIVMEYVKKFKGGILQEFVEGEHVKFYGIANQIYFQKPTNPVIEKWAALCSKVLGLQIFGGDIIISDKGVFFIDVNDFPSFSIMIDEAAKKIAELSVNTNPKARLL